MEDKQDFIAWLSLRGLSPRYIKELSYYFDRFRHPEFNQQNVNLFLSELNNFVSRSFIKNYKEFLLELYPDILQYQKITIPRQRGTAKRKLPQYPTEEEVHKIAACCINERERIMLFLSYYSALRVQGLINITIDDFDWNGWYEDIAKPAKLKVREKGDKERIVFVKPQIMIMLKNWLDKQPIKSYERIWGIGHTRWRILLYDASEKALGRKVSPHKLRHGGATWLLNKGWSLQEVSEFLGHESIATTQIYAHLDKKKLLGKYAAT